MRTYICLYILLRIEPYPPMPKSILARRGRLGYDIQDISPNGSDDEDYMNIKKKNFLLGREGREGNLGWEPVSVIKKILDIAYQTAICTIAREFYLTQH